MTRRHVSLIVLCLLACACSSSIDRRTDAGPDTATDTSPDTATDIPHDRPADDGGSGEHGECSSSADCDGRPCVRVPDEPGGYWMCEDPRWEEATECSSPYPDIDECCTSDDCTGGGDVRCFYVVSPWGVCGGPPPMPHNMCLSDECSTASDCSGYDHAVCLPRHVLDWPRTRCANGTCRVAPDCTAETGGYCAPVHDHCCPSGIQGFFCIYPGACLTHEDCESSVCLGDWETGATTCPDDPPPCPA